MDESGDTKLCPMCGERIKPVAVRCRHCHATLEMAPRESLEFDRGAGARASRLLGLPIPARLDPVVFEQRFLEFAYQTKLPLRAAAVAYSLKIPIAEAEEGLEELAAREVLLREVDDEACVFYRLPGGRNARGGAERAVIPFVAPGSPAPARAPAPQAMAGLLLNLLFPGIGSLVAGKTWEGVSQLVLIAIGIPLCFILIGFPICLTAWGWALSTSVQALHESVTVPPAPWDAAR